MIQQCSFCYRFLPPTTSKCNFCDSPSIKEIHHHLNLEFADYEISVDTFTIDGKKYKYNEIIDAGGAGTILKVSDDQGNKYALKVAKNFDKFCSNMPVNDKEVNTSLIQINKEIKNLKSFTPDLKIYSTGSTEVLLKNQKIEVPYILEELAESTLDKIILEEGLGEIFVPFEEKRFMILNIVTGLNRMHESFSVIHRDLSISNILLVERDGGLRYVFSDFSTAKSLDMESQPTKSSAFANPEYADPLRTDPRYHRDPRIDFLSLGVIMSEIIVGNRWTYSSKLKKMPISARFFYNFFLMPLKKFLHPKITKILTKTTTDLIHKRYHSSTDFLSDTTSFLNSHNSFFRKKYKNQKYIDFLFDFKIQLPFSPIEHTESVIYDGKHIISFDSFRNHKIVFNNFSVKDFRIRGTDLYQAIILDKNTIFLQANFVKFLNNTKRLRSIIEKANGKLEFSFEAQVVLMQ